MHKTQNVRFLGRGLLLPRGSTQISHLRRDTLVELFRQLLAEARQVVSLRQGFIKFDIYSIIDLLIVVKLNGLLTKKRKLAKILKDIIKLNIKFK